MGSLQRVTHLCIPSRQHPVFMHTSPLRHWLELLQLRRLQHLFTQTLLPSVVLMQAHCFVVFVHAATHPDLVSGGHVGAASASRAATPSPATPNSAAPANLSARRLVMVPLANPLANSSKGRPDPVVANLSISSPPPVRRAGPFGVTKIIPRCIGDESLANTSVEEPSRE
jgi:hypothetical protein